MLNTHPSGSRTRKRYCFTNKRRYKTEEKSATHSFGRRTKDRMGGITNSENKELGSLRNMGEGHQQAKENVSEHLFDYLPVVVILVKSRLQLLDTYKNVFMYRICCGQSELFCKFNII